MARMLSAHFSEREFADQETGEIIPIDPALIDGLEQLRANWNLPLPVSSGFRSREHNAKVDPKATDSQHIYGRAADVVPPKGVHILELLAAAFRVRAFASGGIGLNLKNNHVHVDTRTTGRAIWIE